MANEEGALEIFHPLIRKWFLHRYGKPTQIQERVWPEVAEKKHLLATAPTGSGKTLAAFLWALNQLVTGHWPGGITRVVYVSPLKALNNDIQRNLLTPLSEIRQLFLEQGEKIYDVKVMTRSGDTPGRERQWMLRHPPEVLITTPESLNLLLSSKSRQTLTGIRSVILDEIHAVVSNKRGTHLITAVDRLVLLSGEFQRIGLSATIRPLEEIADFMGGFRLEHRNGEPLYRKREVSIVESRTTKQFQISVCFPQHARERLQDTSLWLVLVEEFKKIIRRNRSTLLFVNTRMLSEKIAGMINEGEPGEIVYSHHGSLSKEIRIVVEERLKQGELAGIVATSSLELGIDIGSLDEVVLIQTPPSVASGLQRIGRAGHAVGDVSRGALYPIHGRDFLDAALMAESIMKQDIEETQPVLCPLDVLSQVIISMAGVETWDIERLYTFLRTSFPFHTLSRKLYNHVIEMLAGRYAETRIRELEPRISRDLIDNTIAAKKGALSLIYHSGGTIPDRGYFVLRFRDSGARIGELDEEFVWERSVGDRFHLGAQTWRITAIDHQNVEVVFWDGPVNTAPFWRAERQNRGFHFSEKIGLFLETWNDRLSAPELIGELEAVYSMGKTAAEELRRFLHRQKEATGVDLPHRHHTVIEQVHGAVQESVGQQVIIHTLWGGKVNLPFALALSAAWEERHGQLLEYFYDDDSIILLLPPDSDPLPLLSLVTPENLVPMLRKKLEKTGFFGARFRENAGRALLLPKRGFKKRMPLWITRLRSKKLLDAVMKYEDFPILVETWRTCLQDSLDLDTLKMLLEELERGDIRCSIARTQVPSPFGAHGVWIQTGRYMYDGDTPLSDRTSGLKGDLIKEAVFSHHLRPQIKRDVCQRFQEKLQRIAPGYSPDSPKDLLDWVKERILVPEPEWQKLLAAVHRDHGLERDEIESSISSKLASVVIPGATLRCVIALELIPRLLKALRLHKDELNISSLQERTVTDESSLPSSQSFSYQQFLKRYDRAQGEEEETILAEVLGEWLRFYGPLDRSYLIDVFGPARERVEETVTALSENQAVVIDNLTETATQPEVCDAENLEHLLRLTRVASVPSFEPLSIDFLPLFLASYQGITAPGDSIDDMQKIFERLFGYPAPAVLWETEIFPARLKPYSPSWLDMLMQQSELRWLGCGKERISFCFSSDFELFTQNRKGEHDAGEMEKLFPDERGMFSFWDIQNHTGLDTETLLGLLWKNVWQGRISNNGFLVVRKGIENRFKLGDTPAVGRHGLRGRFSRWQVTHPISGNWYRIRADAGQKDALEEEELMKDRVRQVLQRYGILFRELLSNELPHMRWKELFRTLRIMELSGEIVSGHFFTGIQGLQFISPPALRLLQRGLPKNALYWLNACDPASLCGVKVEKASFCLPPRVLSNHVVFHGTRLVLVSKRRGREIELSVPPDDPLLPKYLELFRAMTDREFMPLNAVKVETVNGKPVQESRYSGALLDLGFKRGYRAFGLQRGY